MAEVILETDRLLLRPWRVAEAAVHRELWTERDPRVPPHRRIDADGHPTVAEIEDWIRAGPPSSIGLPAVERKATQDVIGYCGLIDGRGAEGEPGPPCSSRSGSDQDSGGYPMGRGGGLQPVSSWSR